MNTKDNRQQRSEANELELGRIVGELIDCRKLIIGITTGFTVIAVLYALMATLSIKQMRLFKSNKSKAMQY